MSKILVFDISFYNTNGGRPLDFVAAKASGAVGVIAKASEGATWRDPAYSQHRAAAKAAGLLWGAYHFGTAAPVNAQVDAFLDAAHPDDNTLMVLDFEHNDASPTNTMTGHAAIDFLGQLSARLGRKPTLYTGAYVQARFGAAPVEARRPYRVWWAQYAPAPRLHATWDQYWLWQFTEKAQMPGIGLCDGSSFAGSAEDLAASWIE